MNVIPHKNLRVKSSNQHLRIATGLHLALKNYRKHRCNGGKDDVTEDGWHGLFCVKSAGRLSRHSNLKALIMQNLASTHFSSVLEPRQLHRTDQKRPDNLTLVISAAGMQLLWNKTVVDSLASDKIQVGSVCNPETAVARQNNDNLPSKENFF